MLTGEIGCGKTLTRAVFVDSLDPRRYAVVVQESPVFRFTDLLAAILQKLDPEGRGESKFLRWDRLQRATAKLHAEHRHLVLIFDEAQEMAPATLNELKLLTNLNGGGQNYLTIVLLGQPELRDLVASLPAIDQRISLRYHLHALDLPACKGYINYRLRAAGHPTGEIFGDEAVDHVFAASKGIPRELNRLAKLSLEYAWLREMPSVTTNAVDTVVRDLNRHQQLHAA